MIRDIRQLLSIPENRIVALVFLSLALAFGAFIVRLPEIKSKLKLSEAELGTSLFFVPLGAAILLPFYSKIISWLGERLTTSIAICFLLLAMIFPGLSTNQVQLMISLFFIGLGMGLTDVSMNAEAAEIERQRSRVIMSSCHGFFSLGGMVGALSGALFIRLGIGLVDQMMILAAVLLLVLLPKFRHMINGQSRGSTKTRFKLPPIKVLAYAAIGLCIMMSEGGISEWSSIFLKEDLMLSGEHAGLGFAGFSLFMALGRFKGDGLQVRYGGRRLVISGALMAIAGLVLVLLSTPVLTIVGFSLAGLGYSVIVPILFSASARVEGIQPSRGIASVASAGYIGMLMGPVVIGYIAEAWGLVNGFTFLLGLTTIGFLLSLRNIR